MSGFDNHYYLSIKYAGGCSSTDSHFLLLEQSYLQVYDQNFYGGSKGGGWGGGNSEMCLKWGGVIKESQLKLLKRGVSKARSC